LKVPVWSDLQRLSTTNLEQPLLFV